MGELMDAMIIDCDEVSEIVAGFIPASSRAESTMIVIAIILGIVAIYIWRAEVK